MHTRALSAICEANENLGECRDLLISALKLGFRRGIIHRDAVRYPLDHIVYHNRIIDVVFPTRDANFIADTLFAWTSRDTPQLHFPSLSACAGHLANLVDVKFSPRFRRLVTRAVDCIGYRELEWVGTEKLVHLLNKLETEVHEMEWRFLWTSFLSSVFRSPPGLQNLASHYWQWIVSMAKQPGLFNLCLELSDLETMRSFEESGDWEKLEVLIGLIWILELPEGGVRAEV